MVFADGKRRVAFLESSVRHFAERRRRAMLRSARFSQMSDAERADIIRRAKRMASRTGCCLHELSKRLASRTGRAVETIRYTIRRHDQENPTDAVFPGHPLPLDAQGKEIIYRCFLHGVAVTSLAERYQRTRGSIYRVINEMRARHLMSRKIDYVYNPQFDLPAADRSILAEESKDAAAGSSRAQRVPRDLPPYLRSLYELPLLTAEQERHLFRKYNYVKYRADALRKKLNLNHVRAAQLRQVERLLAQSEAIKNQIIRANLRLVVSIAKKHLSGPQNLFELISDGNISLMRAVEKFDYSRGYKFSTYASWAIMKNFARSVPRERYLLDHFLTGIEEILDVAGGASRYDPRATSLPELRESIQAVLAQLSPRERSIIVRHFGLDESSQPLTLDQLSRNLGISKERVRQIEQRAMAKLREMLEPVRTDLMR
jgi:RNA polymerase primary sigma factor